MKTKKILDLGEYIVKVTYDDSNGYLKVDVLDEIEVVIESIEIVNSDEKPFNPSLN